MDFILDPDESYDLATNGDTGIFRVRRFVPHRPGTDVPYYAVYSGPIGPNPDLEADSWAEVLKYLAHVTGWTEPEVEARLRSSKTERGRL
jgi:hypothetical protein